MLLFRPDTKFTEPLSIGQHLGLWIWWAAQTAFVVFLLGGIVVSLVGFFSDRPEAAWLRLIAPLIYFTILAAASWIGGRVALFLFASK